MSPEPLEVLVRCECLSPLHVVSLQVYADPRDPAPSAFLQVTAPGYLSFWDRIRAAWEYVWGGHPTGFDTVCLTRESAARLREGLDAFIATTGSVWPGDAHAV